MSLPQLEEKFLLFQGTSTAMNASLGTLGIGRKGRCEKRWLVVLPSSKPMPLPALRILSLGLGYSSRRAHDMDADSGALVVSGDFSFANAAWFEDAARTTEGDALR